MMISPIFLIIWFAIGFIGVLGYIIAINRNFLISDIFYSLLLSFLGPVIFILIYFFHMDTIHSYLKKWRE